LETILPVAAVVGDSIVGLVVVLIVIVSVGVALPDLTALQTFPDQEAKICLPRTGLDEGFPVSNLVSFFVPLSTRDFVAAPELNEVVLGVVFVVPITTIFDVFIIVFFFGIRFRILFFGFGIRVRLGVFPFGVGLGVAGATGDTVFALLLLLFVGFSKKGSEENSCSEKQEADDQDGFE
jgi:hypothetical protein